MRKVAIAVVVVLALASCTTLSRWWMVIDTDRLSVGMTMAEAGKVTPLVHETRESVSASGTVVTWIFERAVGNRWVFLYFLNGRLSSWDG